MSPRQSDTRQRVVVTAAKMLAQHGLNATSIRELAQHADAPLGSTYHHFPGGKQQVIVEAVKFAGSAVAADLERHLQAGMAAGLSGFLAAWRDILLRSDFHIGCPVTAVAIEEPIDNLGEEARNAAAQVFSDWERILASGLEAQGHAPDSASRLATLIVASVEGAIVLCRAQRNISAFDKVAEQLEWLVSNPSG
jgi:AcrR family transcriptional regulator